MIKNVHKKLEVAPISNLSIIKISHEKSAKGLTKKLIIKPAQKPMQVGQENNTPKKLGDKLCIKSLNGANIEDFVIIKVTPKQDKVK